MTTGEIRRRTWLLAKSFVFCAGLWGLFHALSWVALPTAGSATPWPAIHETRQEADVLVMGSSMTYCTVLPMEMWRSRGLTVLDVTQGGQKLPTTLTYLEQALQDQSPRLVMVEVSQFSNDKTFDLSYAHGQLDPMPFGWPKAKAILRFVDPSGWAEVAAPLHFYHTRWKELSSSDYHPDKFRLFTYARGAYYLLDEKPSPDGGGVTSQLEERDYDRDLAYIRRMVQLCEKRDAQVVLFLASSTPHPQVNGRPVLDCLQSDLKADHPSVAYLDLTPAADEIGIDPGTDYGYESHLNYRGGKKLSVWLADHLVERYGLTDHRSDKLAARWNASLDEWDEARGPDW